MLERRLSFEYRWIPLDGGEPLAGKQEEALGPVVAWAAARGL